MKVYDPNEPLLPNLRINSAGSHLYCIGLSHFKVGFIKRRKLFNPWLVFIISVLLWLKFNISMLIKSQDNEIFILLGDFLYFIGLRYQTGLIISLYYLFSIISQIIHYKHYTENKFPAFLKPFYMLSGIVTPKSIGLSQKSNILKLLKHAKYLFKFAEYLLFSFPFVAFLFSFYPLAINSSIKQMIFLSFPWSVLFAYGSNCVAKIIIWQMIYFNIICYYLNLKIIFLNEIILNIKSRKIHANSNTNKILIKLHKIHREILDSNNNYWSIFLFWTCLIFTEIFALIIFLTIFTKIIFIRNLMIYSVILNSLAILYPINSCCILSQNITKSRNYLMHLYLKNNRYLLFCTKFKVCLN
jgi:hypothetical protein